LRASIFIRLVLTQRIHCPDCIRNPANQCDLKKEADIDMVWEFSVAYGSQIFSAVIILLVGLKGAAWVGGETQHLCETKIWV
jgi:hypothetical protein